MAFLVTLAYAAAAQSKASLDVNETLFTVVAGMNVCGYDQELRSSSPIRSEVRTELAEAGKSPAVAAAARGMCRFYDDHRQGDSAHDLAQYTSLALNLGPPPGFALKMKEADFPPDASYVLGFVPVVKDYYAAANLHAIWLKHQPQYQALIRQYHDAVSQMISSTDTYLRMPMSGYSGRSFTIYLEPMIAPGHMNSRNYLQDFYYVIVSPAGDDIHMDALRHTYLHFVLDPLIAKRATALDRLKPVLLSVQRAPMSEDYKEDMGLLVTECLIRAIEARTSPDPQLSERSRLALVQRDEAEGFVLTGYFYEQLRDFEKAGNGLQDEFPNWLHNIDVAHEKKRAAEIAFATHADPELMQAIKRASQKKIDLAERALAAGNLPEAGRLAQESLQAKEDAARAYFVLASIATFSGDMQGAQADFQKALDAGNDPRVVAWSHIYLGRIFDLQGERDSALAQYNAALATSDAPSEAQTAAQRGLQQPYEPPTARHQDQDQDKEQ